MKNTFVVCNWTGDPGAVSVYADPQDCRTDNDADPDYDIFREDGVDSVLFSNLSHQVAYAAISRMLGQKYDGEVELSEKAAKRFAIVTMVKEMIAIFEKHKCIIPKTDEAFWHTHEDVADQNELDGQALNTLAEKFQRLTNRFHMDIFDR